jgi:hypothetical protein
VVLSSTELVSKLVNYGISFVFIAHAYSWTSQYYFRNIVNASNYTGVIKGDSLFGLRVKTSGAWKKTIFISKDEFNNTD